MLGLGSSADSTRYVVEALPSINLNSTPGFYLVPTATDNSGTGAPAETSNTSFDVRILVVTADFDKDADSPSDFTLTNVTVTNSTTGATQLLASSVTMDNFVNFGGSNTVHILTDADSPLDNVDLSSDSGQAAAHNGVGLNTFVFNGFVSRKGFSGSIALTQRSINLNNS